ncbi:hypothetical protein VTK26DRAFT_2414 [Humicola hyalothermophila]
MYSGDGSGCYMWVSMYFVARQFTSKLPSTGPPLPLQVPLRFTGLQQPQPWQIQKTTLKHGVDLGNISGADFAVINLGQAMFTHPWRSTGGKRADLTAAPAWDCFILVRVYF